MYPVYSVILLKKTSVAGLLLTYYCAVGNALSGGGNSGFNNNGFNNNGNSYNACGKRRKRQVRGDFLKKKFSAVF